MRPETRTIRLLIDHIDYRLLAAIHAGSEAAIALHRAPRRSPGDAS